MSERRSAERLTARFKVLLAADRAEYDGEILDVSARGAQLASENAQLPAGVEVRMQLLLRSGSLITILGRVVWSNAGRFALEFTTLDEAARKWLDSMLGDEETSLR